MPRHDRSEGTPHQSQRGPAPSPQRSDDAPDAPLDHVPDRLAALGFGLWPAGGQEVVLVPPPLCDVPAGPFFMGSDPNLDPQATEAEQPQHQVMLGAFQIARFPVTVAEYAAFLRTGYRAPMHWTQVRRRPDHPVVGVTWHDALAYAMWLTALTGEPWRLPTEAQWEKAARWDPANAHARIYPWGDTFDASRANTQESPGKRDTTPAGTYPSGASPCGAQDMAGNVWEWTSSLYQPYPYVATDGREDVAAQGSRVLRGGNMGNLARYARAANRYHYSLAPDLATLGIGFRLVRVAAEG
jgi:formylglycine-generating enzyme required for sulfatase activity